MNIEQYSQILAKTKDTISTNFFDTNIYQDLGKTDFIYLVDRFQTEPWFAKWVNSFPIEFWKSVGYLLKLNAWLQVNQHLEYMFVEQWLPFATHSTQAAQLINKKEKLLLGGFPNNNKLFNIFDLLILKNIDSDILNTDKKQDHTNLLELVQIVNNGFHNKNWLILDSDLDFQSAFFIFVLNRVEEFYPSIKRYDENFLNKISNKLKNLFINANKRNFKFNNYIITSKIISDDELKLYSIQNKNADNLSDLWMALYKKDHESFNGLIKSKDYHKVFERINLFYTNPEIEIFNGIIKNIDNNDYVRYNIYLIDPFKYDGLLIDILFVKKEFDILKLINQNYPNKIFDYFESISFTKLEKIENKKDIDWLVLKEELYISLNINKKNTFNLKKI